MPSQVFFMDLRASAKEPNFKKFQRLLEALDVKSIIHRRKKRPLMAVKLHFGEKGNTAFIRPIYVRQVVDKIWDLGGRPFLTDANTVYVGTRSEAVSHLTTAIENGFAYAVVRAPLVIADGLTGKAEVEVEINREQFKTCLSGRGHRGGRSPGDPDPLQAARTLGLRRRPEKPGDGLRLPQRQAVPALQHRPQGDGKEVHRLRRLRGPLRPGGHQHQPGDGKGGHRPHKCVGCAECILVCPYGNIQIQWNESIPVFLKKMMEYAYGVMTTKRDRGVFVNFITQVSPACDCYGHNDLPIVGDIGILASRDPVAIDQACADLVNAGPGPARLRP